MIITIVIQWGKWVTAKSLRFNREIKTVNLAFNGYHWGKGEIEPSVGFFYCQKFININNQYNELQWPKAK